MQNEPLFYLGTHHEAWLAHVDVPLFVSDRRLRRRRRLPRARCRWALDSGAFSELREHGRWTFGPTEYAERVARYRDEVGLLDWAAPMDYMVEPFMLERTGLTVEEHQHRTIDSVLALRGMGLPIVPVLQGWTLEDYVRHVEDYADAGVELAGEPIVGLGSVCRRQATGEITRIVATLAELGIALHGFGVKVGGVERYGPLLASFDSMAWSYDARRADPLPGCTHANCANCERWALAWRERVLERLDGGVERHDWPRLFA